MAGIAKRLNKDGEVRWRVLFSRKGMPRHSRTFGDFEEALQYIEENEEEYILNPEKFQRFGKEARIKLKKLKGRYVPPKNKR